MSTEFGPFLTTTELDGGRSSGKLLWPIQSMAKHGTRDGETIDNIATNRNGGRFCWTVS